MCESDAEISLTIKPNSPSRLEVGGCTNSEAHRLIMTTLAGQMWEIAKKGLAKWKEDHDKEPTTPLDQVLKGFTVLVEHTEGIFFQEMAIRPIREVVADLNSEDLVKFSKIANRVFAGRVVVEVKDDAGDFSIGIEIVDSENNTKYFNFLMDSVKAILKEWEEIQVEDKVAPKLKTDRATSSTPQKPSSEDLSKADELIRKVIGESDFTNM